MTIPSASPLAAMLCALAVAAVAIAASPALGQTSGEPSGMISLAAVASLQLGQDARDLAEFPRAMETFAVSGRTYLLAVGRLGTEILDVTDPRSPIRVADMRGGEAPYSGDSAAAAFAASGDTYVMTATSDALKIINVTIPGSPAVVAEIQNGHDNAHVLRHLPLDLVGERLGPYQAARTMSYSWNDLEAVDTFADVSGNVYAILASLGDNRVLVVDVTVPQAPVLVAKIQDGQGGFYALDNPVDVDAFALSGRAYALVSSFNGAIQVVNLTSPGAPAPVASMRDGQDGLHLRNVYDRAEVFAARDKAYALTHGYEGARIVDVTDPGAPTPVASIVHDWYAFGNLADVGVFDVSGAMYALAHYDYGLRVINVTDPEAPMPVADIRDERDGRAHVYDTAVFASGGGAYALVADGKYDTVRVIDIGEPAAPELVAELKSRLSPPPSWDAAYADMELLVSGGGMYALVADAAGNAVRVVDITEPAAPRHVTDVSGGVDGFHAMSRPHDIATFTMSGAGYALVASGDYGAVQVLDFTDIEEPIAVAEIWDGAGSLETFESSGHIYAILLLDRSIHLINVTEPAAASTVSGVSLWEGYLHYGKSPGVGVASAAEGTFVVLPQDFAHTAYVADITDTQTPEFLGPVDIKADKFVPVFAEFLDIETFYMHGRVYAIIAGYNDIGPNGNIQILDITRPRSASYESTMVNGHVGLTVPETITDVEVFTISGRTYALTVGHSASTGVSMAVLDITDPEEPEAVVSTVREGGILDAGVDPTGAEIFAIGGAAYAVLVDVGGSTLQVVALTTPDA